MSQKTFRGVGQRYTTSNSTLEICSGGTNGSLILQCDIANTCNDSIIVKLYKDAGNAQPYYIVYDVLIPSGSTLQTISGQKMYLDASHSIKLTVSYTDGSDASGIVATINSSLLDGVNA